MLQKKGQIDTNIINVMVILFLAVVFFAGLIYVQGLIYKSFQQVGLENEKNANNDIYVNLTQANEQTFGVLNDSIQSLRLVSFMYMLSIIVLTIIVGAFERKHPFLFFIYILIMMLALILAPIISNAYETLLQSNIFEGVLQSFTLSNFIMLNLPIIVLIMGTLGSILLFVNLIRDEGATL